ncbi:hypothetical protein R3P38DRAFT_3040036 [Favolaschia claudopus]|uniref:Pheromone receptor n=1 Tax=Favolaschia claudopus TaxID=2862362 RepID=A0AAW0A9T0_9AGAR
MLKAVCLAPPPLSFFFPFSTLWERFLFFLLFVARFFQLGANVAYRMVMIHTEPDEIFNHVEPDVIGFVFALVAQTFLFGIYSLLFCCSLRMLIKRGLEHSTNKVKLAILLFMALMSATYWSFSVFFAAQLLLEDSPSSSIETLQWLPVVNAAALINFVISDGMLIWTALTACSPRLRKYLWISVLFLFLTVAAVVLTIVLTAVSSIDFGYYEFRSSNSLHVHPEIPMLVAQALSVATNLSAAAVYGVSVCRRRQMIQNVGGDDAEALCRVQQQIRSWAAHIGVFYSLSTLLTLIFSLISLPNGTTLGDFCYPLSVQIASIYPPTALLLIDSNHPLAGPSTTAPSSAADPNFDDSDPSSFSRTGTKRPRFNTQFGSDTVDISATTTMVDAGLGGGLRLGSRGRCCSITVSGPDILNVSGSSQRSTPKRSRFSDTSSGY